MICRRRFLGAAICLLLAVGAAKPAAADAEQLGSEKFITSLANKAVASLTDQSASRQIRIDRFREMFRENFAIRSIGKFVLGRNWKKATEDEQKVYLELFEDLMVVSYVDRFARYAGEALTVIKSRPETEQVSTVFSNIARPGGAAPIAVNWRVGNSGGVYKILDVVVEGTSMSATLRSDFGSIVRRNGNGIAGLIEELRIKTAALKAEISK